jgi:hypothetical protein
MVVYRHALVSVGHEIPQSGKVLREAKTRRSVVVVADRMNVN